MQHKSIFLFHFFISFFCIQSLIRSFLQLFIHSVSQSVSQSFSYSLASKANFVSILHLQLSQMVILPVNGLWVDLPVLGSHKMMRPFLSAEHNLSPSGDHATAKTQFLWPCRINGNKNITCFLTTAIMKMRRKKILHTSHNLLVQYFTSHVWSGISVVRSQNLTVVSPDPLASWVPSGPNATLITASAWPGSEDVHLSTGNATQTNTTFWAF